MDGTIDKKREEEEEEELWGYGAPGKFAPSFLFAVVREELREGGSGRRTNASGANMGFWLPTIIIKSPLLGGPFKFNWPSFFFLALLKAERRLFKWSLMEDGRTDNDTHLRVPGV